MNSWEFSSLSWANKVKQLYCNRQSLFGNFTVLLTNVSQSIQPFFNKTALRDCPDNRLQNFINLFGERAVVLGDFAGFECNKLSTGNT